MNNRRANSNGYRSRSPNRVHDGVAKRQKPVSYAILWTCVTATLICSAIFVWLFLGNVSVAQFGIWPRVVIAVALIIFITASLTSTEIVPWTSRSLTDWRQPKVLGTLIYMTLGAVSFAAGLANIFNPPAAEQKTLLETKEVVADVKGDTGQLVTGQKDIALAVGIGAQSLIGKKIAGKWGRPGCAVTYNFTLDDRALKVRSVKSAPGMKRYDPEFSVVVSRNNIAANGERSSIMETTESVGFWPGFGVQFQYFTDGSTERLVWDHKKMATMPLELVRC